MQDQPDSPQEPDLQGEATRLLASLCEGDQPSQERLLELVYEELRRAAASALRRENAGHTLQATALVNEAWMRLIGQSQVEWQGHDHFLAVAATAMRRVLVDHARSKKRDKRGGGAQREDLHSGIVDFSHDLDERLDVLTLHEGLEKLQEHSERAARVVELRFFAGMPEDQVARTLGVARPTVTRDWAAARAWLSDWMSKGDS